LNSKIWKMKSIFASRNLQIPTPLFETPTSISSIYNSLHQPYFHNSPFSPLSLSLSRLLQRSNIFFSRNKQNDIKKGVVFDPSLHNLSLLLYLGRGCLPPPCLSPSTLSGLHHSGAEHGWLLVVCVKRQHFKKARRDLLFWFENGAGHWRWVPLWGLQEQCSIWCRLECH